MPNERKRLSDILSNGNGDNFRNNWNNTDAAGEFGPLPPGEYTVRILSGELFNSRRNATPGYKLTCEVTEGEYKSRRLWLDWWLTQAALPMTRRDLAKIGIERPEQLEQPLPPGILAKVKVALRRDDDGNEANRVKSFEYVGVEPPDAFAPGDGADDNGSPPAADKPKGPPPNGQQSQEAKPDDSVSDADAVHKVGELFPKDDGPYGGNRR